MDLLVMLNNIAVSVSSPVVQIRFDLSDPRVVVRYHRQLQLPFARFSFSSIVSYFSNLFLTLLYAILRVNPTSIVCAIDTSCRRLFFAVCWQNERPNLDSASVLCCVVSLYRDSIRLTIGLGLGRSRTGWCLRKFKDRCGDFEIVCAM
jgi:hypothetical protein